MLRIFAIVNPLCFATVLAIAIVISALFDRALPTDVCVFSSDEQRTVVVLPTTCGVMGDALYEDDTTRNFINLFAQSGVVIRFGCSDVRVGSCVCVRSRARLTCLCMICVWLPVCERFIVCVCERERERERGWYRYTERKRERARGRGMDGRIDWERMREWGDAVFAAYVRVRTERTGEYETAEWRRDDVRKTYCRVHSV